MVAFTIKGDDLKTAHKFVDSVELFTLAESLGGVESLIGHPATMTHASIPKEVREKVGVTDGLIRLSLGVEDAADIIADLKLAFEAV
jgi:cystathionine gamma-lyase